MEIIGGGKVHVYEAIDEGPHPAGPQEMWQESVVLVWWDQAQAIGGFYRIGHELNHKDGPMIALWNNTWTPQGFFKKTAYLPLRPQDRIANGFGSGDDSLRFEYDGQCVWTLHDEEISATLRVEDFHPAIDCYPKKGAISEFAPHHAEVSGRVRGTLTAKGHTYTVNALGFRDHGWGERLWPTLLSHRWMAGVFDQDLSFCALSWHGSDDTLVQFGWIVRDDKVIYGKDVDILVHIECDAMTVRGGALKMTLTTGEVLDVTFERLANSVVSFHHGIACVDTMCRIRYGDRVGIADLETSSNPQHGTRKPQKLSRGVINNGWHPVG
ncbi:MAG: DUF7065 domain-containing protein [Panacagrimonas sp.]